MTLETLRMRRAIPGESLDAWLARQREVDVIQLGREHIAPKADTPLTEQELEQWDLVLSVAGEKPDGGYDVALMEKDEEAEEEKEIREAWGINYGDFRDPLYETDWDEDQHD